MAETINSLDGSVCAPTAGRGCCACQPFPGEHQLPLEGISLPTPPPFSRCFVFEHWIETGKSWVEAFCTPVMGFEVPGGSPAVPLSTAQELRGSHGALVCRRSGSRAVLLCLLCSTVITPSARSRWHLWPCSSRELLIHWDRVVCSCSVASLVLHHDRG